MRRDDHVDFFIVRDEHLAVHDRLEGWARWVRVRPTGWQVAPMFRHYRPIRGNEERREPRRDINIPEAWEVEQAIAQFESEAMKEAVRWFYYWSRLPRAEARAAGRHPGPVITATSLGVSKQGLLDLIHAGRSKLAIELHAT